MEKTSLKLVFLFSLTIMVFCSSLGDAREMAKEEVNCIDGKCPDGKKNYFLGLVRNDQPLIAFSFSPPAKTIDDEHLTEVSMKLSEDFTKKLRFSEEGERIRKLERSWSKLEDSVEFDEEEEGGEEEEFSFACVNAEGSSDLLFDQNDGVSETDDEEINQPRLRKVFVESHIPTEKLRPLFSFCRSGSVITQIRKRTNASIRISKENNDDLVEDVLGDRGSVSARNPPPARSDHSGFTLPPFVSSVPEYASVDFDQRRETEESSLGMVSLDRFYGYESSFPGYPGPTEVVQTIHVLPRVGSLLLAMPKC
ncbi:hypothetical protein Bca52824_083812 [Brassica carinata]|uniref:Uncharacterized protein n=1 Tax=Brassica carinata TaxID=52824 RepID=A0A8X7PKU9_BRACI|nr:hypothetical protein Bca52824_083812 [Brassica carinata]